MTLVAAWVLVPTSATAQAPVYLAQWPAGGVNETQFSYPAGVATDAAGDVFVMVTYQNAILKFSGSGAFIGRWDLGSYNSPTGIATDPAGNVYVVIRFDLPDESGSSPRVRKYSGSGTLLTSWGSSGSGDGQFNNPHGVATDASGYVYVADAGNGRVQKFTSSGAYVTQWGAAAMALTTDASGNLYVAGDHRVQKFTSTGVLLGQWGSLGSGNGQFGQTFGIATDVTGDVYVADFSYARVQKFTSSGAYITQWGSDGSSNGQFHGPFGVATDIAGNVFVADSGNYRIQKFGPDPTPTTSSSWGRLKTLYRP